MFCKFNEARICEGCMWCYDVEDEEDNIEDKGRDDESVYIDDYVDRK